MPRSASRRRWQIISPAFALILALGAVGAWFTRTFGCQRPKGRQRAAELDTSKIPAIAVLPFNNLSGDPKQDYFSEGLTEDILTELSRARDLRVLARNTTFHYKGQAVDVVELGRELGVALRTRGQHPAHRQPPPRHGATHRY